MPSDPSGALPDFDLWRTQFPTLERLAYLSSGSYGLLHPTVEEAFADYLEQRKATGADWDAWIEVCDETRALMARLLNVGTDEIAITGAASDGMNAVACSLDFPASRNRIVMSTYEFPTSGQIWHAQAAAGAEIVPVPEGEDGLISAEAMEAAIDERTRLVVMSHVCFRHGARFSDETVRRVARKAHAHGALILLDIYQSVGSLDIDVRDLEVDFAVGGMLKYLLGCAGAGFLYVRRSVADSLRPRTSGWFSQEPDNMMNIFAHRPGPGAIRFQGGTPPVPACFAARAGLRIIMDIGTSAIAAQNRMLTGYAADRLADAGIVVRTPREDALRGPMVAISSPADNELVEALAERGVVTSCRAGNVRAGFHFYNNRRDADRLVDAIIANPDLVTWRAR